MTHDSDTHHARSLQPHCWIQTGWGLPRGGADEGGAVKVDTRKAFTGSFAVLHAITQGAHITRYGFQTPVNRRGFGKLWGACRQGRAAMQ
jgi:hypothetical protein